MSLAGSLYHMKPKRRDQTQVHHENYVKGLSDDALRAIVAGLKHNQDYWSRCRKMAAMDEMERRKLRD